MPEPITFPSVSTLLLEHRWPDSLSYRFGKATGRLADMVFADPPYNIGVKYADDPFGDQRSDYQLWVDMTLGSIAPLLRKGGMLWWLCPSAHMDWVPSLLADQVGRVVHRVVKRESFAQYNPGGLTDDYRMLFGVRRGDGGATVFNGAAIRVESERARLGDPRAMSGGRVPGAVWDIRRLQGTSVHSVPWHPCQVAPELLRRLVLGWTNPGDLVVDAFAGSGNMGLCCRREGRNCVLVDCSPTYLRAMAERIGVSYP